MALRYHGKKSSITKPVIEIICKKPHFNLHISLIFPFFILESNLGLFKVLLKSTDVGCLSEVLIGFTNQLAKCVPYRKVLKKGYG
jgi:hypothetical protein